MHRCTVVKRSCFLMQFFCKKVFLVRLDSGVLSLVASLVSYGPSRPIGDMSRNLAALG